MPAWECCYVDVPPGGPVGQGECAVYTLKKDGKHWLGRGQFGPVLADLGSQGWELCTSSAYIDGGKVKTVHLFKRQMAG